MNVPSLLDFRTAEPRLPFERNAQDGGALGESPPNGGPEVRLVPAVLDGARFFPVYSVFRHRLATDLFCAVPEDRPVPTFIEAMSWTFGGRTDALPEGAFDPEAAATAMRFIGFTCLSLPLAGPPKHSAMMASSPREPRPRSPTSTHPVNSGQRGVGRSGEALEP